MRLDRIPAYIINLDRSPDRWVKCFRSLSRFFPPERIERVSGSDGLNFSGPGGAWREKILAQCQKEGNVPPEGCGVSVPSPTIVALSLSHQAAMARMLEEGHDWALIFEDDARLGHAAPEMMARCMYLDVPSDTDVAFLHDRTTSKWEATSEDHDSSSLLKFRITKGGIGLEAYLISAAGARKIIYSMRPLIMECDVQLMTFLHGYSNNGERQRVRKRLTKSGKTSFPEIKGYTTDSAVFTVDRNASSVKLSTIATARKRKGTNSSTGMLGLTAAYFNPMGYEARRENFVRFIEGLGDLAEHLIIAAACPPDGACDLPEDTPGLHKLTAKSILWHKEALLNAAFAVQVDAGYPNVAWLDADVMFMREDWYEQACKILEEKRICQLFSEVETHFPDQGTIIEKSPAARWLSGKVAPGGHGQTGLGWAMQSRVWEAARLYDLAPVGGGDHLMWNGLFTNYVDAKSQPGVYGSSYKEWAPRWSRAIGMEIGCVKGRIVSLPHGPIQNRGYHNRTQILRSNNFDALTHLERNEDNLLEWTEFAPPKLIDGVKKYFSQRKEDLHVTNRRTGKEGCCNPS